MKVLNFATRVRMFELLHYAFTMSSQLAQKQAAYHFTCWIERILMLPKRCRDQNVMYQVGCSRNWHAYL